MEHKLLLLFRGAALAISGPPCCNPRGQTLSRRLVPTPVFRPCWKQCQACDRKLECAGARPDAVGEISTDHAYLKEAVDKKRPTRDLLCRREQRAEIELNRNNLITFCEPGTKSNIQRAEVLELFVFPRNTIALYISCGTSPRASS